MEKHLPELIVCISSYLDQILILVFLSYIVCTEFVISQFLVMASDTLNKDNTLHVCMWGARGLDYIIWTINGPKIKWLS